MRLMRALSIRQPFAELILRGIKTAELRSMSTTIVGERFLIYACKAKAKQPIWSDDLRVGTPPAWMIESRRAGGEADRARVAPWRDVFRMRWAKLLRNVCQAGMLRHCWDEQNLVVPFVAKDPLDRCHEVRMLRRPLPRLGWFNDKV